MNVSVTEGAVAKERNMIKKLNENDNIIKLDISDQSATLEYTESSVSKRNKLYIQQKESRYER